MNSFLSTCVCLHRCSTRRLFCIFRARVYAQVKVRKFTLKAGMSTGNTGYDYVYSLWQPIAGRVQTVSVIAVLCPPQVSRDPNHFARSFTPALCFCWIKGVVLVLRCCLGMWGQPPLVLHLRACT